jgi:hypothetical protein
VKRETLHILDVFTALIGELLTVVNCSCLVVHLFTRSLTLCSRRSNVASSILLTYTMYELSMGMSRTPLVQLKKHQLSSFDRRAQRLYLALLVLEFCLTFH